MFAQSITKCAASAIAGAGHGLAAVALSLCLLAGFSGGADADETYICDGGRMVTVRFGDLERMARTDACIAAYVARRGLATAEKPAAPEPRTAEIEIPLPERRPQHLIAAAPPAAAAASVPAQGDVIVQYEAPPARVTTVQVAQDDGVLRPRVQRISFRHAPHHFHSDEELPKGPADFRRVPIINAGAGEPKVFYHAR